MYKVKSLTVYVKTKRSEYYIFNVKLKGIFREDDILYIEEKSGKTHIFPVHDIIELGTRKETEGKIR